LPPSLDPAVKEEDADYQDEDDGLQGQAKNEEIRLQLSKAGQLWPVHHHEYH